MPGNVEYRIQRIWTRYKRNRSQVLRQALIEHYRPLLRIHARRLRARLADGVDVEELASAGTIGLMKAVESFDPDRGIKFETFSGSRIHGSMIDELRELDWVPRLVRSRAKGLAEATADLETATGRAPTWDELAARLNVSAENLKDYLEDGRPPAMYSLTPRGRGRDEDGAEVTLGPLIDGRAADPVREAQRHAVKEWVTKGLSSTDRMIIVLYYYEEMTMEAIGETLGMSESRVSQLHKLILERFRARLTLSGFRRAVFADFHA